MLTEFDVCANDQFIRGWVIDEKVCEDLCSYFEAHPNKNNGVVNNKYGPHINEALKKSTDISISPNCDDEVFVCYMKELGKVIQEYRKSFSSLDSLAFWGIKENVNVQRYLPNEGFFAWHSERSSVAVSDRLLVFTTYLNDVVDGGQTEWLHQKLLVSPKKGLTVITPVDWMYVHRGVTSPTENKYIATGWISYV
jgi:hypothetical protein